jgi:FtsP/CotA-like multicopper oxidase with cupredoxin domain
MYLIAMDGKYLQGEPLLTTRVIIPPGGRADVLVQCRSIGLFDVTSTSDGVLLNTDLIYNGPLLSLNITKCDKMDELYCITNIPVALPPIWSPLYSLPRSKFPANVQFDIHQIIDLNDTYSELWAPVENARDFLPADYRRPQEWSISTKSGNLPYHQGVHPFQVVAVSDLPFENTGLLSGMWRDTVPVSDTEVTFRFWAQSWDRFPGFSTILYQRDRLPGMKETFRTTNILGFNPYERRSDCSSLPTLYPCGDYFGCHPVNNTVDPNSTIDPDSHKGDIDGVSHGASLTGSIFNCILFIVLLSLIL